jgi:hypothetical protein
MINVCLFVSLFKEWPGTYFLVEEKLNAQYPKANQNVDLM